jgi:predicted RNase H-like HicB family nuclease
VTEKTIVRYTVLLLPDTDPDVFVAPVPVLGVVTQGRSREDALVAAREAATLAPQDLVEDGEEVYAEPRGAIVETIDVSVPVPA